MKHLRPPQPASTLQRHHETMFAASSLESSVGCGGGSSYPQKNERLHLLQQSLSFASASLCRFGGCGGNLNYTYLSNSVYIIQWSNS